MYINECMDMYYTSIPNNGRSEYAPIIRNTTPITTGVINAKPAGLDISLHSKQIKK